MERVVGEHAPDADGLRRLITVAFDPGTSDSRRGEVDDPHHIVEDGIADGLRVEVVLDVLFHPKTSTASTMVKHRASEVVRSCGTRTVDTSHVVESYETRSFTLIDGLPLK